MLLILGCLVVLFWFDRCLLLTLYFDWFRMFWFAIRCCLDYLTWVDLVAGVFVFMCWLLSVLFVWICSVLLWFVLGCGNSRFLKLNILF